MSLINNVTNPCIERDSVLNTEKKKKPNPAQMRCTTSWMLQQLNALKT